MCTLDFKALDLHIEVVSSGQHLYERSSLRWSHLVERASKRLGAHIRPVNSACLKKQICCFSRIAVFSFMRPKEDYAKDVVPFEKKWWWIVCTFIVLGHSYRSNVSHSIIPGCCLESPTTGNAIFAILIIKRESSLWCLKDVQYNVYHIRKGHCYSILLDVFCTSHDIKIPSKGVAG